MTNAQICRAQKGNLSVIDLMELARQDESNKYAHVIYRDSYAHYAQLLSIVDWDNDTEEAQKCRTESAAAWLEDVLSYYVNKHDGECIKIEITNTYQR